jgi:hypothetical protein
MKFQQVFLAALRTLDALHLAISCGIAAAQIVTADRTVIAATMAI